MSAFLQEFQLEAEDNLTLLEEGLLRLEQLEDPEVVRRMFTAAHTIKGSAGMLGLSDIQRLTHSLEDALDQLRKNPRPLSQEQANILLEVVDEVRAMCAEVMQPIPHEKPLSFWLERLKSWDTLPAAPSQPASSKTAPSRTTGQVAEPPAVSDLPSDLQSVPQPAAQPDAPAASTSIYTVRHAVIHDVSMTARMHQAWLLLEAGFSVRFALSLPDLLDAEPGALWVVGYNGEKDTADFLKHLSEPQKTGVIVSMSDSATLLDGPFRTVVLNLLETPDDNSLVHTALDVLGDLA
ncbi:Hpt domain-containing protein [Deinococcus roseus]|nr:Hpt domain-containing protein [Deinococcus roseus]